MHVAYIHQHFSTPQGATGTRSYEFSRRLIAAGHRVTMICGASDMADPEQGDHGRSRTSTIEGIHVIRIPVRYANRMGFARRVFSFGRFARAATRAVCRLDANLVLATSTPLTVGLPGLKGARRLGVPFVFEVRDLWPELPIAMGILRNPLLVWYSRRLERRIYRAANHIIALAPGIKEGVTRAGYDERRISLIPNGSDLDLFRPTDAPLEDPRFGDPGEFRFVFTGAHGLANGLDAVLDAARTLKERKEHGIRFVFIGEGAQRDRLTARSHKEGLDSFASWIPSMPKRELARVLPRMDAGMMILKNVPSFYEGTSPNKFFDYLAAGLPVLNNYPGWVADLIRRRDCGKVVPPDDPGAFADAVIWLRDHRDEARAMGRRARALAEAEFSRDVLADRFVHTLERVYETCSAS